MQESTIFKISLITTIVGLTFLLFYADQVETPIVDLNEAKLDDEVKVRGEITSLRSHENTYFLEVAGERIENVDVILFSDEEIFLQKGNYVELTGVVEEYKGKKEVIADKVILKS